MRSNELLPAIISATVVTHCLAEVIDVPADQPTIQAAINAAQTGDEVVIAPGTYLERINLMGKAITVRGTDPSDWAVVEATIIDGNAGGPTVECISGEGRETLLSGVVITNGLWGVAGGMMITSSSPTVDRCIFRDNEAQLGGAITVASSGDPLIAGCVIRDNLATGEPQAGGGIANVSGSRADVLDTVICGNTPSQIHGQYDDLGGNTITDDCPGDCPADLDGSGDVAVGDLLALLAAWGTSAGDVTSDGTTDVSDLLALLAAWGGCA